MRQFFAGRFFRIAIVVLVGGFVILSAGVEMWRAFGHPLGDYGFASDGRVIAGITPGGPAERAGLHRGDRIAWVH